MPIARDEQGFLDWPDAWTTPALGIESARLAECVAEVRRRKLVGVFGTRPYFHEPDLDFLLQIPNVQDVQIYDVKLRNIDALYRLSDLQHLRLTSDRPSLSLDRLPGLKGLVWPYRKGDSGVDRLAKITSINSWRFKSSTGDLSLLALPPSVMELGLFWCNAERLDGLSYMPKLKRIWIERCRNLSSIQWLSRACPELEHVVIAACGRVTIEEAESLAQSLPKLRHLFAANKLIRKEMDAA